MNKLDLLKEMTVVVADTGDINSIAKFSPKDATTNPSLILKSAQNEIYKELITDAVNYAKSKFSEEEKILDKANAKIEGLEKIVLEEKTFRWMHNEDAMATEKLAEGIRNFTADTIKLEKMILQML